MLNKFHYLIQYLVRCLSFAHQGQFFYITASVNYGYFVGIGAEAFSNIIGNDEVKVLPLKLLRNWALF